MKYSELASLYSELENTSKTLEKTALIAAFLKKVPKKELPRIVLLIRGSVSPDYETFELGIGKQLVIKAISQASGVSEDTVKKYWKEIGDIGEVAEKCVINRKQATLFSKSLTVEDVFETLRLLPSVKGKGAVDRKLALLKKLLISSKPNSSKYIARTVLGELRIGVGTGGLRDAIAKAFDQKPSDVEAAFSTTTDFRRVIELASEGKLAEASISLDKPLQVMLYQKEASIEDGFKRVGRPAIVEYKYDGFRVMIHKDGRHISLFTRRLDNITARFPDIVEVARNNIKAKSAIVDTEVIGIGKGGTWLPFQAISQRIKRKYRIDEMIKDLPVQACAFDLLYLNGKSMLNKPLKDRYAALKKIVKEEAGKIELAKQIVTSDEKEVEKFYAESLAKGNEGVMMKKMDAEYKPGSRVGFGVKIKPTMEPLDLVILGAEWGSGKRAAWLSSFVLGCRKGDKFLKMGKVGTGIKEKEELGVSFKELTKILKVVKSIGRDVIVKPEIVIEVAYEEIQKSPTYESGYALRFPRLLRLRPDKPLSEVDSIKRVERLYKLQRGIR